MSLVMSTKASKQQAMVFHLYSSRFALDSPTSSPQRYKKVKLNRSADRLPYFSVVVVVIIIIIINNTSIVSEIGR